MLLVIIGSIGAGKTTLARNLEQHAGFIRISADDVRLEMTGSSTSWSPVVWSEVQRRANDAVANDSSVVIDATGAAPEFPSLIQSLGSPLVVRLECEWRTWQIRELRRERQGVKFPQWRSATIRSRAIPAWTIHTDNLKPSRVFAMVVNHLGCIDFETLDVSNG